jgi:hypothetical protein
VNIDDRCDLDSFASRIEVKFLCTWGRSQHDLNRCVIASGRQADRIEQGLPDSGAFRLNLEGKLILKWFRKAWYCRQHEDEDWCVSLEAGLSRPNRFWAAAEIMPPPMAARLAWRRAPHRL